MHLVFVPLNDVGVPGSIFHWPIDAAKDKPRLLDPPRTNPLFATLPPSFLESHRTHQADFEVGRSSSLQSSSLIAHDAWQTIG